MNLKKLIKIQCNTTIKSCASHHVSKYDKYKGVQRYLCNDCGT